VKSTAKADMRYPNKPSYKINVRRGADCRAYEKDEFDYYAIYLIDIDIWFIIPFCEVQSKTTIRINVSSPNCSLRKYMGAFDLLS
jgi:hypothetical protein